MSSATTIVATAGRLDVRMDTPASAGSQGWGGPASP